MTEKKILRGFTFIEVMVVVAILALLAILVIPRLTGRVDEAKITKTVVQIREIMQALELYRLDNGRYPTTEQGLEALVEEPRVPPQPKKWKQYMDKLPKDSWGNNFIYVCPSIDRKRYFDLYSIGPDAQENTQDDIKSWDLPE
jgi:general secretion pathway protein G